MSITLGSNIASLRAQQKLVHGADALARTFERLSSGQRINRASDDAAGLAVSSSLDVRARIFTQGVRNLNDGLSLLNIADQAIANLSSIVSRQLELAEQSANGVYSNAQRAALEKEARALADEYNRIIDSTSFNGMQLLDGSLKGVTLQAGAGGQAVLNLSLTGSDDSLRGTGEYTSEDLPIDIIDVSSMPLQGLLIGDFNSDGIDDFALVGLYDFDCNCFTYSFGLRVSSYFGLESGTGYTQNSEASYSFTCDDWFGCSDCSSMAVNLQAELVSSNTIRVYGETDAVGATLDFDITGCGISYLWGGPGPTTNQLQNVIIGDFNGDGVDDRVSFSCSTLLQIDIQNAASDSLRQQGFSLATQLQARSALTTLREDLNFLSSARGTIGAAMARVEVASNVLTVSSENYRAAAAQIRDTDVAQEAAAMTRLQILQNAAAAVLAAANAQPQLALQLLQ